MSDKYAAIAAERGHFPIRLMCAALGVSVGGFYDAQARQRGAPPARVASDEQLLVEIRVVFTRFRKRYGAPRVHRELRGKGIRVAKHRVAQCRRMSWSRAPGGTLCGRRTPRTAIRSR